MSKFVGTVYESIEFINNVNSENIVDYTCEFCGEKSTGDFIYDNDLGIVCEDCYISHSCCHCGETYIDTAEFVAGYCEWCAANLGVCRMCGEETGNENMEDNGWVCDECRSRQETCLLCKQKPQYGSLSKDLLCERCAFKQENGYYPVESDPLGFDGLVD